MPDEPNRWTRLCGCLRTGAERCWLCVPRPLRLPCEFVAGVLARFGHSGSNLTAAAIAFYGLVCLTPLGIIAVALLQHLTGSRQEAADRLELFITQMSPAGATERLLAQIDDLLAFPQPLFTGGLGVLALVWAATRLFETIARALNSLWPDSRDRGFFVRQLIGFATMLAAGIGLAGYMVVISAAVGLRDWLTSAGLPADADILPSRLLPVLVALPFAWLAFFLLYKLVPARQIATKSAALGALLATLGFWIVQPIFAALVSRTGRPESLYGSLSTVVIFAMWMYVVGQLLLFGAHVVAQAEGTAIVPMEGGRKPIPTNNQPSDA